MAVGLKENTELYPVMGLKLAACSAGIYKKPRPDLVLIECSQGTNVSAVFTRNAFYAAPVAVAREHLGKCNPLYLLINAGNANAGLGKAGYMAAIQTCQHLAELRSCNKDAILPFSTGVIGEPLPVNNICNAMPELLEQLSEDNWLQANRAILTTDTVTKTISRKIIIDQHQITITGMAKGSGMIRPDMATMLAFIGTDAAIHTEVLDDVIKYAVNRSFNCISVDGDTSTNDACVIMATGKSGMPIINTPDSDIAIKFREVITEICVFLAQAIVRDGEGATKFVTLDIRNGIDTAECQKVADAIAHSPLVKTALFASDPNWGRILAAVGRAELDKLDVNKVTIYIGNVCIIDHGVRSPDYTESKGKKIFNEEEITITVDLNRGTENQQFWTCDFSYDYVRINAEYRT
jgi:glutamate N-acetyltransferase / amino-acid N-acetyltransferase